MGKKVVAGERVIWRRQGKRGSELVTAEVLWVFLDFVKIRVWRTNLIGVKRPVEKIVRRKTISLLAAKPTVEEETACVS